MKASQDEIKLDWLTLVFPFDERLGYFDNQRPQEMVRRVLEIGHLSKPRDRKFEKRQAFGLRYSHALEVQHGVTVLANILDSPKYHMEYEDWCKMGIAMVFSGRALAQYMAFLQSRELDFYEIKHNLEVYTKVKATRIDIAKDIHEKRGHAKATPAQMHKLVKEGYVRGQRRGLKYKWIESGQHFLKDGLTVTGETLYLGSRKAEFQLRIYDKLKERIYSHGDTWRNPNGFHIRWEIELKGCLAVSVWDSLESQQDLIDAYHRLLAQKVKVFAEKDKTGHEIKVVDGTGNIMTYKAQKWYAEFVGRKVYCVFTVSRPISTMTTKQRWFEKNIRGVMREILAAHTVKGGDPYQLVAHWIEQDKLVMSDFELDWLRRELFEYTPHNSNDLPDVGTRKEVGLAEILEEYITQYDR